MSKYSKEFKLEVIEYYENHPNERKVWKNEDY